MRKILLLVCILGLLTSGSTAIAESSNQPIVEFWSSKYTKEFQVYRFYDMSFHQLCYANQNAITCISWTALERGTQRRIGEMVKKNNNQGTPQDIIKLGPIKYVNEDFVKEENKKPEEEKEEL